MSADFTTVPDVTNDLITWIEKRLNDAMTLDEVGLLVLAALEGDHEPDDYLASGTTARRDEAADSSPAADTETACCSVRAQWPVPLRPVRH